MLKLTTSWAVVMSGGDAGGSPQQRPQVQLAAADAVSWRFRSGDLTVAEWTHAANTVPYTVAVPAGCVLEGKSGGSVMVVVCEGPDNVVVVTRG